MSTFMRDTESLSMSALSVVLISPDQQQRMAMAQALSGPQANIVREFSSYPDVDQLADLTGADYDVVIVDLEPDPELALDAVESLCSGNSSMTVMVHSARQDPDLMLRCMRAGAREFLTEVRQNVLPEALVRAAARRDETRRTKTPVGKLLVFAGAKGGVGVTALAGNFAVALAQHSPTALVDLNLDLGDAAVTLGVNTKFTMLDALDNLSRIDSDFVRGLMAKHSGGLAVLGAPDQIPQRRPGRDGVGALLRAIREDFAYVVVDAGSRSFEQYEMLFDAASTVYLVTQVSVPDLRNANRAIARYFSGGNADKLEIVLNRYIPRNPEIDDAAIEKALTRPPKWRVPNDHDAVTRAQNTGTAFVPGKSRVAAALAAMEKAARGLTDERAKRKILGLF